MDFSILSEQSFRTSRLYLRAGSSLMIRTGAPNRRDTRRGGSILRSLSAVSEAPASRQVVDCVVWEGRFRYSDLKEAARRASLWILYVVEQARPRLERRLIGHCGPVET